MAFSKDVQVQEKQEEKEDEAAQADEDVRAGLEQM